MPKFETSILVALISGAVALFGVFANHRLAIRREYASSWRRFAESLRESVALLSEPRNIGRDALRILEEAYPRHYEAYLLALALSGSIRQCRLKTAWKVYAGEQENDAEWWLPNEYGTLISNKLVNTEESTRSLAKERLQRLISLCG